MVSHGSNKYSHAYLTVTQVFIHHRFCWHRTIETAKKTFRTQKLSNRNGSTKPYEWAQHLFCFFFSSTFRNMTKLLSFDANFFCVHFKLIFSRPLESFEFTCFPLLPLFLLNNSVMEKMIYNLLLKASNETGDNKDILCTLYNCTFVDWQLHCSNGLKCHTVFFS